MGELDTEAIFRTLAEQAVQQIVVTGTDPRYFAGASAMADPERDKFIIGLPALKSAGAALGSMPMVRERYGDEPVWERLALQFVYEFLAGLLLPAFEPRAFAVTWTAFQGALSEPEWTYMALANLRGFSSETLLLDLGDGVTIRDRSFEELAEMGWTQYHLRELSSDQVQGRTISSHVILARHKVAKTPDNLYLGESLENHAKMQRSLLAMRLLKDGDVGIGRVWNLRSESFNFGFMGYTSVLPSGSWFHRPPYTLDETDLEDLRELYGQLARYDGSRADAPVNLDLAIRAFSDSYERYTFGRDDSRLVDTIIAAEALLGTQVETTFRLAYRVASLLAGDDDERAALYDLIRTSYNARSRVVHGDRLTGKHEASLRDQEPLRDAIRRLIVGFVRLTNATGHPYNKKFFDDRLEGALLHVGRRSELRAAMGLE